ncbi:MAG TPA: hypothetical protein VLJ11_01145 [Bryobacteraceae bacterium]|nr:hypothetical protein [Bryobacteraceae bacterium]
MRFLAIIERKTGEFPEEQFERLMEPEAECVRRLYSQGIFRSVFSRGDVKGAVIELECESMTDARSALAQLPFASAGLIDTQLIPLLPYRGFAPRTQ